MTNNRFSTADTQAQLYNMLHQESAALALVKLTEQERNTGQMNLDHDFNTRSHQLNPDDE